MSSFISETDARSAQNYTKLTDRTELPDEFSVFCSGRYKIKEYEDKKCETIFIFKL